MEKGKLNPLLLLLTLIATILACNAPTPVTPTESSPTLTKIPPNPNSEPPTELPIQHLVIPIDFPAERSGHAGDYDSSTTASKKVAAGGDRFTFGRFERPFNANTMDQYFPQLDIVDTFVFQDETWIFGKIVLNRIDSSNANGSNYAMELDDDLNGRGDWLVIASNPESIDWSVNGVKIYEDTNNSVGGLTSTYADKEAGSGDGYETVIFDQGKGQDADAAWVRISPADPNTVEIAVKRSELGNPEKYLINMWAGTTLLDPAIFDLNDHFTHEQAGAADASLVVFYPIKGIAEIDNSCKMSVGFQPTGQEPGLCKVLIPVEPGLAPGVESGGVPGGSTPEPGPSCFISGSLCSSSAECCSGVCNPGPGLCL